jgi:hypothetical protein
MRLSEINPLQVGLTEVCTRKVRLAKISPLHMGERKDRSLQSSGTEFHVFEMRVSKKCSDQVSRQEIGSLKMRRLEINAS